MSRPWMSSLLLAAVAVCAPVCAQTQRSGGGEAQKFMQQYQQLAAEKTALQTQVAQAKRDLDAAQAQLAEMKKERDALKARAAGAGASAAAVAKLTESRNTAEKSLEQYKARMNELVGRFRDTAGSLKDVEADRGKLRKDLEERNASFDQCAENNQQLFDINGGLLDRFEHVGLFTKVGAAEPFTKITRTRLDNLVVETRERAEALRVKKRVP